MPPIDLPGLSKVPIIGILRGCPADLAPSIAAAAHAGGLRAIEVTLDSPNPLDQLAAILELGLDLAIGVGTVTHPRQVAEAAAVGAQFVVTPIVDDRVVTECLAHGLPCFPGAATPTEIAHALDLGATAVKVFPAACLGGPDYLAAIADPLRHPPLVPTGGVTLDDAADYLAAGAVALGVGSALFSSHALGRGDVASVGAAVARWVAKVAP
jgi:2-dehydro-3-deoxyphosphogluconate aldolase/(4S)-4-hydroxy-2-oxoglutarate aldolase